MKSKNTHLIKLNNQDSLVHIPVLADEVLRFLSPQKGDSYLDLTVGYGGHASLILGETHNYNDSVLVDRDQMAIQSIDHLIESGAKKMHSDFVSASKELIANQRQFDLILADLGVSSPQLDRQERGFSFRADGPLDMRMDRRQDKTAELIVNQYSKDDLIKIITNYGEENHKVARVIADAIIANRPITTTKQLADIISTTSRGWSKRHPATRTFQALRIEVNQELRLVEELLPLLPKLLTPNGRVAIISFHSIEDRLVKRFFQEQARSGYEAEMAIITKKAIKGSEYDVSNPRSRSAKLRVAVKK